MPMKTHLSPTSQKKDLGYALRPYKLWDEWINSQVQPFTKDELDLIEVYRETNSYAACNERLKISMVDAANEITAIIMRLRLQVKDYKRWEAGQRSLFEVLRIFDLQSLKDLEAITVNDLKTLIKEPFTLTYKQTNKPP